MQLIRSFEHENASLVGWGVRVMLLTAEGDDGPTARRLAGLGGRVETATELYAALSAMIDDPAGYALFVVDCDAFGGLAAGKKAFGMLGTLAEKMSVILVSRDCPQQIFPDDRCTPTLLRAPVSAVSLRVGFEHALRERSGLRMI